MKKFFLITLFYLVGLSVFAQDRYSLTIAGGTTYRVHLADGYFYSFNLGVPIGKFIEIAPTFSYANTLTPTMASFGWNLQDNGETIFLFRVPESGAVSESVYGDILGSATIMLFFKPFAGQLSNYELALGAGIGLKNYQSVSFRYKNDYIRLFDIKTAVGFEPVWFKAYFNRKLSERTFLGVNICIDGYDGDAMMNLGAQFGVRF